MDLDIPELSKLVEIIEVDFRTFTGAHQRTEDTCTIKCYLPERASTDSLRDLFCSGDLLEGCWRKTPFSFLIKELSVTGGGWNLQPSLIEISMVAFSREINLHPIMAYRRKKGLK